MRKATAVFGAAAVVSAVVVPGSVAGTAMAATDGATDVTFTVGGQEGPLELFVPRSAPMLWANGQDDVDINTSAPASVVTDMVEPLPGARSGLGRIRSPSGSIRWRTVRTQLTHRDHSSTPQVRARACSSGMHGRRRRTGWVRGACSR